MRRVHFIGIGGVGMNGLAQLAAQSGYAVTGSDRAYDPSTNLFQCLEKLNIQIFPQDGSGLSETTTQSVFSTAIEPDNPDLIRAKQLGISLLHRSEFLKELVDNSELIAVAGTAGKTTTTGLLGWIFQCLNRDPSVYNGAAVLNWKTLSTLGNIRKGASNLWIIEADESDKSFLNFSPTHSIITNISKDHYELDELHCMFNRFETQTSGITVRGESLPDFDLDVPMLGKHNLENARCAFALCHELGLDEHKVRKAISSFQGIERRLEIVGEVAGITVIDDYAHNPAKMAAALSAVAEAYGIVHAFWRPHGFKPLAQGLDDFIAVLSNHWKKQGGSLFVLPVYYAGGTVSRTVDSNILINHLNSVGVPAELVTDYAVLKRKLEKRAISGDAILGMGARDPNLPIFAKELIQTWKMV